MSPTHLRRAGKTAAQIAEIRKRAEEAQQFVARTYGGRSRPMLARYDVDMPNGDIVEVKSVPTGFSFIDAGDKSKRPHQWVAVVSADPDGTLRIAGVVSSSAWVWGVPAKSLSSDRCWYASPADILEAPDPATGWTLSFEDQPARPSAPPRLCPSCSDWHPAGTTCAHGWRPWTAEEGSATADPSDDLWL